MNKLLKILFSAWIFNALLIFINIWVLQYLIIEGGQTWMTEPRMHFNYLLTATKIALTISCLLVIGNQWGDS